jgi:quercetin dioxygenase-like cupin family protein
VTAAPGACVVRGAEAETLHVGTATLQLLVDASHTGGAVGAHRVRLGAGEVGANPHRHQLTSELFYVLDGAAELMAGEQSVVATAGDLAVVPPGLDHAFAAASGRSAELLVLTTPGIERFAFFRQLAKTVAGEVDLESFLRDQAKYDTYPAGSTTWRRSSPEAP